MKVSAGGWQSRIDSSRYSSSKKEKVKETEKETDTAAEELENDRAAEEEEELSLLKSLNSQSKSGSGSGMKIKSSAPNESVGSFAGQLARAENKLDVQLLASKVMRSQANLKMSAANAEGNDKKKIQNMIRRMEKLMKRIQLKLRQLGKEERLEREHEKAVKEMDEQKAKELSDELKSRRKKRRKEERKYAQEEQSKDMKEANADTMSALGSGAETGSPVTGEAIDSSYVSTAAAAPVMTGAEGYVDAAPMVEGAVLDVSV